MRIFLIATLLTVTPFLCQADVISTQTRYHQMVSIFGTALQQQNYSYAHSLTNQLLVNDQIIKDRFLQLTAYYGDVQLIQVLIGLGAKPSVVIENTTALHLAVLSPFIKDEVTFEAVVKALNTSWVYIKTQDTNGNTAMHMAAQQFMQAPYKAKILQRIFGTYAWKYTRNNAGKTAADSAREQCLICAEFEKVFLS